MTALFYAYMDSPIGRLLMLSDGENLTNLDCCLLYTSDAADEEDSVDLGGPRIIKKKIEKKIKKKDKKKK